jgi:hypothetical protein
MNFLISFLSLLVFGAGAVLTNVGKGIAAKRHVGATPAQAEPKYVAMGTGATAAARTAAAADTALSTEVETRTAGTTSTVTTTQTNDTFQVVGTITATAARAVDEVGTFDASSAGNMADSITHLVVNLANGDSLQYTIKTQFT